MYNLMKDGNNIESEPKRKQGQRLRKQLKRQKAGQQSQASWDRMRGALYKMNNDWKRHEASNQRRRQENVGLYIFVKRFDQYRLAQRCKCDTQR